MLKYRLLPVRAVHPFIDAGPCFRTRHNPGPSEPSQIGAVVWAGAEVRAGRRWVSPSLRYTRWQQDPDYPSHCHQAGSDRVRHHHQLRNIGTILDGGR